MEKKHEHYCLTRQGDEKNTSGVMKTPAWSGWSQSKCLARIPHDSANRLKLVTERAVITALQTTFLALPFARLNQVLQAARALQRRLAALGAALIPLHA